MNRRIIVPVLVGLTLITVLIAAASADREQGDAAYSRGDLAQAVHWYQSAASAGDPAAQVRLGWLYRKGNGVSRDDGAALNWFNQAARQGHAGGQFSLGTLYQHGRGVPQDYAEAARWYRLAADQGNAGAENNLGWFYQKGLGVRQDYAEAAHWYRLAANQNQPDAEGNLGLLYLDGLGVPRDRAEAERLLRGAALQGDHEAAAMVARLFDLPKAQTPAPAVTSRSLPDRLPVYGAWRSKAPIRNEGLRQMYLSMEIKADAVTFKYDCHFLDGSILVGTLVTHAEVSASAIRILDGGVSRASNAENQCVTSIRPITLPYRLSGQELSVTFSDHTVPLQRTGAGPG